MAETSALSALNSTNKKLRRASFPLLQIDLEAPSPDSKKNSRRLKRTQVTPLRSPSIAESLKGDPIIYECTICGDELALEDGVMVCHLFCNSCAVELFKRSMINTDEFPASCCPRYGLPYKLFQHLLSETFVQDYQMRLREFFTPMPLRVCCSNRECALYIHPENFDNSDGEYTIAHCQCGTYTCVGCKAPWEPSHRCYQGEPGTKPAWMPEYSDACRIKQCPNCQTYFEHMEACNHMACSSCKFEFCFVCLLRWTEGFHEAEGCPAYGDPSAGYDEEGYEKTARKLHRDTGRDPHGRDRLGNAEGIGHLYDDDSGQYYRDYDNYDDYNDYGGDYNDDEEDYFNNDEEEDNYDEEYTHHDDHSNDEEDHDNHQNDEEVIGNRIYDNLSFETDEVDQEVQSNTDTEADTPLAAVPEFGSSGIEVWLLNPEDVPLPPSPVWRRIPRHRHFTLYQQLQCSHSFYRTSGSGSCPVCRFYMPYYHSSCSVCNIIVCDYCSWSFGYRVESYLPEYLNQVNVIQWAEDGAPPFRREWKDLKERLHQENDAIDFVETAEFFESCETDFWEMDPWFYGFGIEELFQSAEYEKSVRENLWTCTVLDSARMTISFPVFNRFGLLRHEMDAPDRSAGTKEDALWELRKMMRRRVYFGTQYSLRMIQTPCFDRFLIGYNLDEFRRTGLITEGK